VNNKNEFIIHNPIQTLDQLFAVRQKRAKKNCHRPSAPPKRAGGSRRKKKVGPALYRHLARGAQEAPAGDLSAQAG
jgi:hypothetical protein